MGLHRSSSLKVAAVSVTAALALGACGGGHGSSASSASSFCDRLSNLSVQFAGLPDSPSRALVRQAAAAADQLHGRAPGAIESALATEAHAYDEWAKTGDDTVMDSNVISEADDTIGAWESSNCKQ
jgi:hypothetical protein